VTADKTFTVGPLPDDGERVYSEKQRQDVRNRVDPPPVRFYDPEDVLAPLDLAAFLEEWLSLPRDERAPHCLSRAQVNGTAPIFGAAAWARARRKSR
jgi:hypothetical protein